MPSIYIVKRRPDATVAKIRLEVREVSISDTPMDDIRDDDERGELLLEAELYGNSGTVRVHFNGF